VKATRPIAPTFVLPCGWHDIHITHIWSRLSMTWYRKVKTVCTCNIYYDIINLCSYGAHVIHILWYHQLYSYGAHTLGTTISPTLFIWCTCIKYKPSMTTWDFNHIIWQEHYYNGNIKRQVILKELKEFRKSPTFSFKKSYIKTLPGFWENVSLTWYFLSSILATFSLD
jgi:hypothetical protein